MRGTSTDSAMDALARAFKAHNGSMTRAEVKASLSGFPFKTRKAAITQLELVADIEWAKPHGGRPLPGDRFYWPKRPQGVRP